MADELIDPFDVGVVAPVAAKAKAPGGLVDPFDSAPMPTAQPKRGIEASDVARQSLGQGLALGFGDEIEGFARGIYEAAANGVPLQEAINKEIDYVRQQNESFEAANPKTALGLQVAGGMLTGGAGGARALGAKGLSMGAKALRGAGVGAGLGGTAGVGMSEGGFDAEGLQDRATAGLTGAAIGGVGGAALAPIGAGLSRVGKAAGRLIPGGAERQAQGQLRNMAQFDDLAQGQAQKALDDIGPEGVVADIGTPHLADLARWTGNRVGGKQAQEMLKDRSRNQFKRVGAAIDETMADVPLDDFMATAEKVRRQTAKENYGKLYDAPVKLTDEMKGFFSNPRVQSAYENAKDIAETEGVKLPPLFKTVEGSKQYATPNMRMLDYIKRSLDDNARTAFNEGKGELGSAVADLRNRLLDHIDDVVPAYKKVRSEYAGQSAAMDAAELGAKLINTPRTVGASVLKGMGEHERQSFITGVADALRYKVNSTQYEGDVTKKIFNNPEIRKRIKLAFGKDSKGHSDFVRTMKAEEKMAATNANVRFGSRTQPMAMDEGTFSKVAQGVGDVAAASQGYLPSAGRVVGNVLDKVSTPPEAVAAHLEPLLFSKDPIQKAMALRIMQGGETVGSRAGRNISAPLTGATGLLSGK